MKGYAFFVQSYYPVFCPTIPIHPACQDAENEIVKSFREIAEQLFAVIVLHIGRFCINLPLAKSITGIGQNKEHE